MTAKEILNLIYENGRVTSDSSQKELENEFEFVANEDGWSDDEIRGAIESPWFPKA